MRSIAARLAVTFGVIALAVFSLSGLALYQALAGTLERQQVEDLRAKLEMAERLIGDVKSVERWDELRKMLTAITTTDGNTRFWIACENTALTYGYPFPERGHPRDGDEVRTIRLEHDDHPLKTLGSTLRPIASLPEVQLIVGVSTAPATRTLHAFALAVLAISLCGILFVAALGYWVARFGLRPLARLSDEAQGLSPKNLSQRLSLAPPVTELSTLAASFNGALDRLECAYGQLASYNADVAHELRTPIGNLIGVTQVALTRERSAQQLREALQSNLEDLERLRAIVNDMLFLARADQGETAHCQEAVALAPEVRKTLEFLEPLIEEKGLAVEVAGNAMVEADASLFRRAMSNLLHNAIQHSHEGAAIRVEIGEEAGLARVAVSNPGTAIAAEHASRLFDRFYRVDAARTFSAESHGLGLAIVKAIARMHGGGVFAGSHAGINTIGLTLRGQE